MYFDVIIVGAGIAGLSSALSFNTDTRVLLLNEDTPLKTGSTPYAQGGIAFADACAESIQSHVADTEKAGDGLCNTDIVQFFISQSHDFIQWLTAHTIHFDTNTQGDIDKGREGAHSINRIAHIQGDATGKHISLGLYQQIQQRKNITFMHDIMTGIIQNNHNAVCGITTDTTPIYAPSVIFATGGACGLFQAHTTMNHRNTSLYIALQAGATARDLEFFQYHPTALYTPSTHTQNTPIPLISEAIRGAGGVLVVKDAGTDTYSPLEIQHPDKSLGPRHIVSHAIFTAYHNNKTVYLDISTIDNFADKFPTIYQTCQRNGVQLPYIPVQSAIHYHIGGIQTQPDGQTGVEGLYCIGETACTGLHGANRLASNSLLEAGIMGRLSAQTITEKSNHHTYNTLTEKPRNTNTISIHNTPKEYKHYKNINQNALSIMRSHDILYKSLKTLLTFPQTDNIITSQLCIISALLRKESIGCHNRIDYPEKHYYPPRTITLADYHDYINTI